MGRKCRAEVVDAILYNLTKCNEELSESKLYAKLGTVVPRSTYLDHLKRLEELGFVSLTPVSLGRKVAVIVKPELLTFMYALYRGIAVEKNRWGLKDNDVEMVMDQTCSMMADHLAGQAGFLEALCTGDSEMLALMKALNRLMEASGGKISNCIRKR